MTPDQPPPPADGPPAMAKPEPKSGHAKLERRKRFALLWRGLLWFEGIVLAACLSLYLWSSLQLNRERAAVRQRGEPLTLAELVPPSVPDGQNAAKLYQRANAALPETVQRILKRNAPLHDTLNRQELASSRVAIALTRRAAAMSQCNFPHKLQDPLTDVFPPSAMLRQLARLMRQQVLQETHDGQTDSAFTDLRVIFKISQQVAAEPNLVAWLTALTVAHTGYRTLDGILPQVRLTPAQGRAVLQGLPGTDWSEALSHAVVGDRAIGLWYFESLHAYPFWKLDETCYLRLMQQTITYVHQPPFEAQATASIKAEADGIPFYAIISSGLALNYDRVLINRDRVIALSQLAEVAVALDVYHTAYGHYPAMLKDAEPAWGHSLPLDPYSHQPFIYRRTGAKFELYSVGPNGKDDGGIGNSDDKDDIRLSPLPRHR